MRSISAVRSSWRPSPQLRTFSNALSTHYTHSIVTNFPLNTSPPPLKLWGAINQVPESNILMDDINCVMFAQIPILIIFVSILKLSYVGPHRLAWWKVRIGDGPRIPDTRRIPRDTFPPSHAVVHPIQSLISKQGCIFFQISGEYLGIHSHQAPPLCTPYKAWFPGRGVYTWGYIST